jgi:hypothetical protein
MVTHELLLQCPIPLQSIVYIGYVDYVMAKRENLNKLNLSLLKTLTLKEELVKEISTL